MYIFYDINGSEIKLNDKLKLVKEGYPARIGTIEHVNDEDESGMLYIDSFPLSEFITEDFEIID